MDSLRSLRGRLAEAVNRERLVHTAVKLIDVPSPTGEGGAVADRLSGLLAADGFEVERPEGGHPRAPAVAARLESGRPGRTLQFNGHLDTVHLPFASARIEGDRITGSGAADMKAGVAAAVEAVRALRDAGVLTGGSVLLTAHDLHEAPWGYGEQLNAMIEAGLAGDAVLLPEPLSENLPVVGRGSAVWRVTLRRPGPPVHEVMRPMDEPSVIAAGADLVARLGRLDERLARKSDPIGGRESVFVGQLHSGEIFNQYPQECFLEGTRRWLPDTSPKEVEGEFRALVGELERETGTRAECSYHVIRDAFYLDPKDPIVAAFSAAYETDAGKSLPVGAKPFCDDGNSFWGIARRPAITHGPRAGGQHTTEEWVSIDDLVRVARLYAMTAAVYCGG